VIINFLKVKRVNQKEEIENQARLLWGQDLHSGTSVPAHSVQFQEIFGDTWASSLFGDLLEIGCGTGADLEVFSKIKSIKSIHAIDLGKNIHELSKKYSNRSDITVKQGNALDLDFKDHTFDIVYSFGVFHHTIEPLKCIKESHRVLKHNGSLFIYLYSRHENYLLKRLGTYVEGAIMRFFKFFPYSMQKIFCILLAPVCWFIFSLPAIFLKAINKESLAMKIPFQYAKNPSALIPNLQDKLMSPINHRFSKKELEKILATLKFQHYKVKETPSGMYVHAIR